MGSGVRTSQAERILEAKAADIKAIYKEKKGWNIKLFTDGEYIVGEYKGVRFPIIQGSDDGNRGDWVDSSNLPWAMGLPEEFSAYLNDDEDDE